MHFKILNCIFSFFSFFHIGLLSPISFQLVVYFADRTYIYLHIQVQFVNVDMLTCKHVRQMILISTLTLSYLTTSNNKIAFCLLQRKSSFARQLSLSLRRLEITLIYRVMPVVNRNLKSPGDSSAAECQEVGTKLVTIDGIQREIYLYGPLYITLYLELYKSYFIECSGQKKKGNYMNSF